MAQNQKNNIKVGLVGFGTVGSGVAKIILEDREKIASRTGIDIELAAVVDKDTTSPRPVKLPPGLLTDNLDAMLSDNSIDIAVELIGGTTIAKDIVLKMLRSGKHVVTANKALLAEHGNELYAQADKNGKCIAFEASCVGGVPIISALRTGLAANTITEMYGILNGTCNYILSNMTARGEDFTAVLKKAQEKGYAEADPTLDINGGDTAHKLAIMARLAFGVQVDYEAIRIEGIENVNIDDIRYGLEMGYVLKLLAIGQSDPENGVSLRVHPSFVSKSSLLGQVEGPFNAVSVFGHAVGQTMFYGRGAGMMPTASAVVADIIEVGMGNSQKLFRPAAVAKVRIYPVENLTSRFYIRLMCTDQSGVFAQVGRILAENKISISGLLQHEGKKKNSSVVPAIITTHPSLEKKIAAAMQQISALETVHGSPVCIRIVDIPEDDIDE